MAHDHALMNAAAASNPVDIAGVWRNQLESTATFVLQGNNLSGTYNSAVSSQDTAISGPILGFINGDLVAFSVLWPSAAITSWVGQVVFDGPVETIKTLWQMTTNVPDDKEPTGLWASVYVGADNFVRLPAK